MPMIDAQKEAYKLASDASKQLITIASAIITFAATFGRDLGPRYDRLVFAVMCYIAFLFSIFYGVRALFQLTAMLGNVKSDDPAAVPLLAQSPGFRNSARMQNVLFAVGAGLLIAFGVTQLF